MERVICTKEKITAIREKTGVTTPLTLDEILDAVPSKTFSGSVNYIAPS